MKPLKFYQSPSINETWIISLLITVIVTLISWKVPLFWDGITAGKIASAIYNQDLGLLSIPKELQSGNQEFFARYISLYFSVFGKGLWQIKLSIIPLTLLFWYQIIRFAKTEFVDSKKWIWFSAFILIDPTFLGQSLLTCWDIGTFGFFLLSFSSIREKNKLLFFIGMLILPAFSLRAIIIAIGLIGYLLIVKKEKKWSLIGLGLVGIILQSIYYFFHYQKYGYVFSPSNSIWSTQREIATPFEMLKNSFIYFWRIFDFGRVSLLFGVLLIILRKNYSFFKNETMQLFIFLGLGLFIAFIPFSNPIAHRYLLIPIFGLYFLLVKYLILPKFKYQLFAIFIFVLLESNFWLYPAHIAQGWDSSLAFLKYSDVRYSSLDYIKKNNIKDLGTAFPMMASLNETNFKGDTTTLPYYNLNKNKYLLLGNITNDVTDKDWKIIDSNYQIVKTFENRGLYLTLYQLKE